MFLSFLFSLSLEGREAGMIQQLMNFGQYWNAYQECTKLINSHIADNQIYLLRAQCALNMGLSNTTVDDATHVLTSEHKKQEETLAIMLRLKANIQKCDIKNAQFDLKKSDSQKENKEVIDNLQNLLKQYETLSKKKNRNNDEYAQIMDDILQVSQRCMKVLYSRTDLAWERGEYNKYNELIKPLASSFENDGNLQYKVGISLFCNGDMNNGRDHLQKNKRKEGAPKNASKIFTSMSNIFRDFGEASKIIEERNVSKLLSVIRKLNRSVPLICNRNSLLMHKVDVLLATSYRIDGLKQKAFEALDKIIQNNPNIPEAYFQRGELSLETDNAEAALQDFRTANRLDPTNGQYMDGIKRAEEAKKKTDRIDLYRLLGVDKTASDDEIKESYRKLVRKWHPDQFSDPVKKEEAEKMMKAINAAYEVLIDPQQRRLIDEDDDIDPFDLFANRMGGNPFEFLRGFNFMYF